MLESLETSELNLLISALTFDKSISLNELSSSCSLSIPSFLLYNNCPLSLKRSFLSGLYGGYMGQNITYDFSSNQLTPIQFKWYSSLDHNQSSSE